MRVKLTAIALAHDGKLYAVGDEVSSDDVPSKVLHDAVAAGAELLEADDLPGVELATDLPAAIAAWEARASEMRALFEHALELAQSEGDVGLAALRAGMGRVADDHGDLGLRIAEAFGEFDSAGFKAGDTGSQGSTSAPADGVGAEGGAAGAAPGGAKSGNGFAPPDTPPPSGADGDGAEEDDSSAPEPDAPDTSKPKRTARRASASAEG